MFDDPKKELERLEQELLAARTDDEAFEHFYDEILEEFGEKAPRAKTVPEDLLKDVPVRRYGEPAAPARSRNTYTDSRRMVPPAKKKSNGGLVLTIFLECLGIAGVVAWWLLRLL